MSYEAFGGNDGDGHDGCFTEEQVEEARAEARNDERERIISYFSHLAERPIGMIDLTGTPIEDVYGYVAGWLRNGVDVKWRKKMIESGALKDD